METARLSITFRVLHWAVAVIILLNAFLLEEGKDLHRYFGYAALFLIFIRIILRKQKQVTHYNPKAKYVYWSIWTCVLGLALSGFLMGLDHFWGNQTLQDIHEIISNILFALIGVHLTGVFADAFLNKRRTWMVMITGKKE